MGSVSAELIKKLRETTQAGMLDCKKALEESAGDFDKAVIWLREKGIAKANKKAGAAAAEGITSVNHKDGVTFMFELNSQTDFTSNNAIFQDLAHQISECCIKSTEILNDSNASDFNLDTCGLSIKDACVQATAKIGEKIMLRRVFMHKSTANETIGFYTHTNKRISSVVVFEGQVSEEVAKGVAMHVAAMDPAFLNESEADPQWVEQERKLLVEKTIAEGKPKEFAEKIVEGRMKKLLAEKCLVDQPYVKEPSMTVAALVSQSGATVKKFVRFEVGQGIEVEQVDFAEEVQKQMAAAQNK
jgi:elongation factor Ts